MLFRSDFNSWDRASIGLPFGRGAIVLGDPIVVPKDADAQAREASRRAVEDGLNAVHARAYALVGSSMTLAVGPVAVISLMTATALSGLAAPGSAAYVALAGQLAVVTGQKDVTAAAKALKNFAAEFEKPKLKFGHLGSKRLEGADVLAMADLPSLEELRGKIGRAHV